MENQYCQDCNVVIVILPGLPSQKDETTLSCNAAMVMLSGRGYDLHCQDCNDAMVMLSGQGYDQHCQDCNLLW